MQVDGQKTTDKHPLYLRNTKYIIIDEIYPSICFLNNNIAVCDLQFRFQGVISIERNEVDWKIHIKLKYTSKRYKMF
jgi:hypothetical protein